jgi:thiol:disulfide interchange protein DsbD
MRPRPLPLLALLALLLPAVSSLGQQGQRATIEKSVLNVSALRPGDKATAAIVLDIKPGFHAQSRTPLEDFYIKFDAKPDDNPALKFGEPVYPKGEEKTYPSLGKLSVYEGRVVVRVPIEVKADAPPGPLKMTGKLKYQICDDKVCFPPENPKFTIETKVVSKEEKVEPAEPELFKSDPSEKAPTGPTRSGGPTSVQIFGRDLSKDAYVLAFLGAFVVGIIFNVMPCVLPVVPLKAMSFFEVSQHNRAKSLALGAVFSLGLIAAFATLALFVVVLKSLNWGELFQMMWFRVGIIAVLVVMAVSTFGVFTVNVPTAMYRFTPRHDTYVGNFLFGILTAALSTPCTFGMFVGLLTWALAQDSRVIGASLITTVGVGMAFPYFLLSAFPELARRFPRTGPWAELVKQMMGFLLLGTAVYFAKPFFERFLRSESNGHRASDVFWWALFAVVAAAGAFLVVRTLQFARRLTPRLVGVAVAIIMIVPSFLAARNFTYHPHDWVNFTDAALAQAKATGKPVLVEFTADWCGNCHFVEAFVINDRGVVATLKKHDVVMVKADVTEEDAPAKPLLDELNPAGAIPLTVIYSPHRAQPLMLRGIYSKAELQKAVEDASRPEVARG